MSFFSYEFLGISSTRFDPGKTFVRSDLLPLPGLVLLRLLIALYCFSTIVVGYTWQAYNISRLELKDVKIPAYLVIANSIAIKRSFSYFTWLCFWSQAFYFLVSGIHTFTFARRGRSLLHDSKWFGPKLQILHSLWYTSVIAYPFLVSITFWCTMMGAWPTGRYEQWLNLSVHGLNSFFATIEIIIPATQQPPASHLAVLLIVLSLYLGLAYLTRATQDFYVYEWLNPAHGNLEIIIHVIGYAAGISTIFAIVSVVLWAKCRLIWRKLDRQMMKGNHSAAESVIDVGLRQLQELPKAKIASTKVVEV